MSDSKYESFRKSMRHKKANSKLSDLRINKGMFVIQDERHFRDVYNVKHVLGAGKNSHIFKSN